MKGLIIKKPWIDYILEEKKTWEIRGTNVKIRERIALIQSKSGLIIGEADLVNTLPIDIETYRKSYNFHQIPVNEQSALPYPRTYAWVLENPVRYETPKPYKHPQGAVIWVNLR